MGGRSWRWPGRGGRRALLTAESFDNAVITVLALGGSTNAVIHLIAMAGGRASLSLDDFDALSRTTPGAGRHPARAGAT